MAQSVLVFISHSSEDKATLVKPIADDLESCFINIWIDNRKIVPGENLRKSIFRDGLDKADVVLIFFTEKSLSSSWVDREIKHVLREETSKGNNFDLRKIISIFDSKETYSKIAERYPELTDDLLHLMPENYSKVELGQLVSAIWSKYLSLQGGDVATQKQILEKDKEIFQKEKEILALQTKLKEASAKNTTASDEEEFRILKASGKIDQFMNGRKKVFNTINAYPDDIPNCPEAMAFGLVERKGNFAIVSEKGKEFFKWLILTEAKKTGT